MARKRWKVGACVVACCWVELAGAGLDELEAECALESLASERRVRRVLAARRSWAEDDEAAVELRRRGRVNREAAHRQLVAGGIDVPASPWAEGSLRAAAEKAANERRGLEAEVVTARSELRELNHTTRTSLREERDRLDESLERAKQTRDDLRRAHDAALAAERVVLEDRHLLLDKSGWFNTTALWAAVRVTAPVHWRDDGWQDAVDWIADTAVRTSRRAADAACERTPTLCVALLQRADLLQRRARVLLDSERVSTLYRRAGILAARSAVYAADAVHNATRLALDRPAYVPTRLLPHLRSILAFTEPPTSRD